MSQSNVMEAACFFLTPEEIEAARVSLEDAAPFVGPLDPDTLSPRRRGNEVRAVVDVIEVPKLSWFDKLMGRDAKPAKRKKTHGH